MATATSTGLPLYRLDVDTYHRLAAAGALDGMDVELLDGLLVEMSPKLPAHVIVVNHLMRHFMATPGLWVQVQDPIEAAWDCEPEPDFAVGGHAPFGEQLLRCPPLVVEVAVTTHWLDRGRKAELYAAAEIPTYWLVDVPGRAVEVRTQPGRHGYEQCETYREGSVVPPPPDGVEGLDVAALLAGVTI